jgi:hypothetical protein
MIPSASEVVEGLIIKANPCNDELRYDTDEWIARSKGDELVLVGAICSAPEAVLERKLHNDVIGYVVVTIDGCEQSRNPRPNLTVA